MIDDYDGHKLFAGILNALAIYAAVFCGIYIVWQLQTVVQ